MFNPDWASHPGNVVEEVREELGLSLNSFSAILDIPPETLTMIEKGWIDIDSNLAEKLEYATGYSEKVWLSMQSNYNEDIKRLKLWNR